MNRLHLKNQMDPSYLIQRLNKACDFNNPFSFGGGLRNGGLSDDAMALLQGIFSFDYMGASEFEWGAVPAALQFIAEQALKGNVISGDHRGVFYLTPISYEDGVKRVIDRLLADENKMRLKERCGLKDSQKAQMSGGEPRTLGWLELDNGFFFTIDAMMAKKTKELFCIG